MHIALPSRAERARYLPPPPFLRRDVLVILKPSTPLLFDKHLQPAHVF